MSVYFIKGKGYRYDFEMNKNRYSGAHYKTKTEAKQAEAKRREELTNPEQQQTETVKIQTDMDFLTLANKRLDYVRSYNSKEHFRHVLYHVQRWQREWKGLRCSEITSDMVEAYIIKRSGVSPHAANKDLRYLRALFNYGIKRSSISENPTYGIEFLPEEKRKKYIPPKEDALKVINSADPDTQDYLWSIVCTAARMNEINSLTWNDVNFEDRYVTLWTRKKKRGNREPREVPMISKLYDILIYRFQNRDPEIPWVFWHSYWSRKLNKWVSGPYGDRKKIMKTLCDNAEVKYFRFHPFRRLTASILDDLGVPLGVIQRILGHENRKTTEGYLQSIGEAERDAMRKLENVDIFSAPLPGNGDRPTNTHPEYWKRKVIRPDYEILCEEIKRLGYVGAGKKYGVSDNAVRKWKKHYESQFEN
jgi:integrase